MGIDVDIETRWLPTPLNVLSWDESGEVHPLGVSGTHLKRLTSISEGAVSNSSICQEP